MSPQEFVLLEALNIATTQYRDLEHGYECTAGELVDVLRCDQRLADDYQPHLLRLSTPQVAALLGRMATKTPARGGGRVYGPLVEQHRPGKWRMTEHGVQVLSS